MKYNNYLSAAQRHIAIILQTQKSIGANIWIYGDQKVGYLIHKGGSAKVSKSTIEKLIEFGIITEDTSRSYYREDGNSDIRYVAISEDI